MSILALDVLNHLPQRPKLLLVDDQIVNIRLLYDLFKDEYEVFMASTGEEAIDQCQALMPDLVLLDVVMPGMGGHEVCRRLQANVLTQHVPIIFLTSKDSDADEALGLELGAVDFINKPIKPIQVKARVRVHLALKVQADLLRSVARIDGLTGVPNRRKFDETLEVVWLQAVRSRLPISMLMIDVDFFKRYNDHYGHQLGDACLKAVAQCLQSTIKRPYDLVARYGGEEFACLLPETDGDGALKLAQGLREAVGRLNLLHADSTVADHVTVSIGTATALANRDLDAAAVLQCADQQLYLAKQSGRNRVCGTTLPNTSTTTPAQLGPR
jgi:diguanylate cyclase (GGDEF)-like protein